MFLLMFNVTGVISNEKQLWPYNFSTALFSLIYMYWVQKSDHISLGLMFIKHYLNNSIYY